MTLTQSITMFLNQQGGTFHAAPTEDPVNALATKLGRDVRDVREALASLTQADRIWIRRRGGALPPAVGLHKRRRGQPVTAEGKRQRQFARDVPAYLPDSMCGPVTTRFVTDVPTQEAEVSVPAQKKNGSTQATLLEHLNLALLALREDADETGKLRSQSCATVILEALGDISESRARELTAKLGHLELRRMKRLGGGKYEHFVDLVVAEVTTEMIANLPKPETDKREAAPAKPEASAEDRLGDIILELEGKLARARQDAERLVAVVTSVENERDAALTEVGALTERVTQLEGELHTMRSTANSVSPRVAAILQRYPEPETPA